MTDRGFSLLSTIRLLLPRRYDARLRLLEATWAARVRRRCDGCVFFDLAVGQESIRSSSKARVLAGSDYLGPDGVVWEAHPELMGGCSLHAALVCSYGRCPSHVWTGRAILCRLWPAGSGYGVPGPAALESGRHPSAHAGLAGRPAAGREDAATPRGAAQ